MTARSPLIRAAIALSVLVGVSVVEAAPRATATAKPAPRRSPSTTTRTASRAAITTSSAPAAPAAAAPPTAAAAPAPTAIPTPTSSSLSLSPSSSSPADRDQPFSDAAGLHHRFALTLNPLALVVGRYGANLEALFAPHHAIIASGYVQTFSQTMLHVVLPSVNTEAPHSRLGGELGYRFYSGHDGPTGVFVGPSAVAMPLAYPRVTEDLRPEIVSFMAYGAAFDVGVQAVMGPGFTIGGGVGVMALAYAPPASIAPPSGVSVPSYPEPHVLPRLLVMAGWAF